MAPSKTLRRHLPESRNALMLVETDPRILASKCRTQDVRFAVQDNQDVVKTFVRIKTVLPGSSLPQFIMRQAEDDYISATSMFRAIFPGASSDEEEHEMTIVRRDLQARTDPYASGVWIKGSPDALDLAKAYGIEPWIKTLLAHPTESGHPANTALSPAKRPVKTVVPATAASTSQASDVAPALAPPATPKAGPGRPKSASTTTAQSGSPRKAAASTHSDKDKTQKAIGSSSTLVSLTDTVVDALEGALEKTQQALQPESMSTAPATTSKEKSTETQTAGRAMAQPRSVAGKAAAAASASGTSAQTPKNSKKRSKDTTTQPPTSSSSSHGNSSTTGGGLLAQLKQDAAQVLTAAGQNAVRGPQSVVATLQEAQEQVAQARRQDAEALRVLAGAGGKTQAGKASRKRALVVDESTAWGPEGPSAAASANVGKMETMPGMQGKMDQVVRGGNKRTKVEELEVQVAAERRKVRALVGLVLGLGATAILPYVL